LENSASISAKVSDISSNPYYKVKRANSACHPNVGIKNSI